MSHARSVVFIETGTEGPEGSQLETLPEGFGRRGPRQRNRAKTPLRAQKEELRRPYPRGSDEKGHGRETEQEPRTGQRDQRPETFSEGFGRRGPRQRNEAKTLHRAQREQLWRPYPSGVEEDGHGREIEQNRTQGLEGTTLNTNLAEKNAAYSLRGGTVSCQEKWARLHHFHFVFRSLCFTPPYPQMETKMTLLSKKCHNSSCTGRDISSRALRWPANVASIVACRQNKDLLALNQMSNINDLYHVSQLHSQSSTQNHQQPPITCETSWICAPLQKPNHERLSIKCEASCFFNLGADWRSIHQLRAYNTSIQMSQGHLVPPG